MRNVAPSQTLVRRARRVLEMAFLAVSTGVFFAILGLALYAVDSGSGVRGLLFWGGVVLGLIGLGLAVRAVTWRTENDLALTAGQRLSANLDDRYTWIRNISQRGLGYVDAVLIGPAGVLVLRIVDYKGKYLNEGGKWMKADKRGAWKPVLTNPTAQVVDDIRKLRHYFTENGLGEIPVFGAVVMFYDDPTAQLTIKDPVVLATHLSSLFTRLQRNYLAKERLETPTVNALVRLLYSE